MIKVNAVNCSAGKNGKIKYVFCLLLSLLLTLGLTACGSGNEANTTEEAGQTEHKSVLVVYFSRTGNTAPLAKYAAEYLNADIFEIEAAVPYTDADIAYYTNCRADKEQNDRSARPEIAGTVSGMEKYDTVILGYPIWHGQAPRIIDTFMESYDFDGKTIVPFCTSHSSGIGGSDTYLHGLVKGNVNWKAGRRFAAGTSMETMAGWLNELGIKQN